MVLSDRENNAAEVTRITNSVSLSFLVSLFIFITLIQKIHSMGWAALIVIVPFIMFLLWRLGTLRELLCVDTFIWLNNGAFFGYCIYYCDHVEKFWPVILIGAMVLIPLTIDFVKEVRNSG